jgi:hypothetical protein
VQKQNSAGWRFRSFPRALLTSAMAAEKHEQARKQLGGKGPVNGDHKTRFRLDASLR